MKIIVISHVVCGMLLFVACNKPLSDTSITNGEIVLTLSVNKDGVPFIKNARSIDSGEIFFIDTSEGGLLQQRIETEFLGKQEALIQGDGWKVEKDSLFIRAHASFKAGKTELTSHIELMRKENIFNVNISALAGETVMIREFPIFSSALFLQGNPGTLHWWLALKYTSQKEKITSDTHVSIFSRIHSSDNYGQVNGNVPFWTISNDTNFIGFSLSWCGGWRSTFNGKDNTLSMDVYLPEEETQLELKAGERIDGPVLTIFCNENSDPVVSRNRWISARHSLALTKYHLPGINIPLIYNHWYAVEFDLSEKFVSNQVRNFDDYGFDVFMIDAGWYKGVGSWTPDPKKFPGNAFSNAINTIQNGGALAGLWSCPQLFPAQDSLNRFIDRPGRYNSFMKGWIIDYNALDFSSFLDHHLDTLTRVLGAGWWKFDQEFFSEKPHGGKMKSVTAFQKGLSDARIAYPGLIFEACQGGGKMINGFTDAISQVHWIRDGERTGYIHAIDNIYEALGAIEFMEIPKAQRWTNRINETPGSSDELLRFYCRSCMAGSWGISADLNMISPGQRSILIEEIRNYRQLNEIKKHGLVEFNYPAEYTSNLPVIFYNDLSDKAGIIFYRILPKEEKASVKIRTRLNPELTYSVRNADKSKKMIVKGNEFNITLDPGQMSDIFFIDRITDNLF